MTLYSKEQARRIVQGRLNILSDDDFKLASSTIRRRLYTVLYELHEAGKLRKVLSYRALETWHEVDVSQLESQLSGVQFEYVLNTADAQFPKGMYDLVLVPVYGFNEKKYRLGHGGGWYDRLLSSRPTVRTIGVGVEVGRVSFEPEPHDIPMDEVITER